jgi:TolB-like protein/tetratricopeptide (TPR) repeat protein/predicted Ser/Thr protein kinase
VLEHPMIGETASHYRILEKLGGGGMGEVFLAEDLRLRRRVALKMIRPERRGDEEARQRLVHEAQVASALNHPNIAVIYEIDDLDRQDGRRGFIAMEYVAGPTLAQLGSQGDLPLADVLEIVVQVGEALAEAHDHGVVHRDVKPTNVLMTESRRVKVVDFGVAQFCPVPGNDEETWTRGLDQPSPTGFLIGTVAYMSPEQALGKDVDARTDIFSLGVVLYELLAGRQPFTGRNVVETIDAILHRDAPPLPRLSSPEGLELQRIVRKMMAKDREQRYASMRDVCRELAAVARADVPRSPAIVSTPSAPAVAVMSFANITKDTGDDWLGTGIAETVTADLKAVEGLTVVGRERIYEALKTLALPGGETDEQLATHVGREVGARWVLGGGYQRLGDVVRVTARLTETDTGAVVRTVKIDGRMDGIFELQDRIVRELSVGLRLSLTPENRAEGETQVVDAYEAFSRGMLNFRAESHESMDRAILFFERAVQLDPSYARARLQLGAAYSLKASYLAMPELHERAIANLRLAIELRPSLTAAWRELGGTLVELGRIDEAIEAIQRALSLDPGDAGPYSTMGRALFVGRGQFAEAASWYDKALALNPKAGWAALQLAHCAALLRDFPRGEAAADRAAALQQEILSGKEGILIVGAYMRRGHLRALQGRHAEAVQEFLREQDFVARVDHALRARIAIELHQRLGAAYLGLGDTARAEAAFATALAGWKERLRMGADEPFTRYYAACVYALQGQTEPALANLEKAARTRRAFVVERARIEPEFEGLRGESRFRALIEG